MKRALAYVLAAAMTASALPMTAMAATGVATFKVIDPVEWTSASAVGNPIPVSDAPRLQLKIKDIDTRENTPDSYEFELEFDGAELNLAHLGADMDTDKLAELVTVYDDSGNLPHTVEVTGTPKDADEVIEFKITEADGLDLKEDDIICVSLPMELKKTTEATVEVHGDFGDSDKLVFAKIMTVSLEVQERQVLPGEETTVGYFGFRKSKETFAIGEKVSIKIGEGFTLIETPLYDGAGKPLNEVWDLNNNTVSFAPVDKTPRLFDIGGFTVQANPGTAVGTKCVATVTVENYAPQEIVIATVVDEIDYTDDDELELDVRKVQILAGGEASFSVLGVDKDLDFAIDELVTLELSEGFTFVENDEFYDGDGTVILVESLNADKNKLVVKAPINPGQGFDLEELTIKADADLPLGTEAEMTASMVGYDSVTKVVATVVSEITETPDDDDDGREPYMRLDIPKLQVLEGGTVSYNTFGVDTRYRDFRLDEIVTLTISDGFEFVESPIHDHDGTILQNVEWSADGKTVKVPVYKEEDKGFDMEAMTIQATTAEVGDEAVLTVSAEHYPSVSKVIAVVVDEITETPDDDDKDEGRDPYMFLDIPELQILEGGTVSYSQFNVSTRYRDFKLDEIVTLTISEGFEFVPSAIHDHDGTVLQNVEWSADGKTVKVPVYKYEDTGFDMETMTIQATTANIGDEALLTVSADHYPDVSQVIAIVVDQIQVGSEVSVDEVVELEEDGTVTLQDVELTAIGTNFAVGETLTLTLSSGFVFVYEGEEDHNFVSIVKSTDNELELTVLAATYECNISNMEIKAVTAEVGDIARLTVAGADRYADTTKVAKVVDEITETPDGGKELYATFGVVNELGLEEKDVQNLSSYDIPLADAPELQIKIRDLNYSNATGTPQTDVKISLNNADLTNFDLNGDGDLSQKEEKGIIQLISIMDDEEEDITADFDITLIDWDNWDTFEFRFEGEFSKYDIISMKLPAHLQKNALVVGKQATVEVSGDLGESSAKRFASVIYMEMRLYDEKVVRLPEDGTVALEDIVIYIYGTDFDPDEEITLVLNDGFEFVDLSNVSVTNNNQNGALVSADSRKLVFASNADRDISKLVVEGVSIKATTAKVDDMAILNVSHCDFGATTVAAEVIDSYVTGDFAAVWKLVNSLELLEEDVKGQNGYDISVAEAPELVVKITDAEYKKTPGTPVAEVRLAFEDADFTNFDKDGDADLSAAEKNEIIDLVYVIDGNGNLCTSDFVIDIVDWDDWEEFTFEIRGELEEDDQIRIKLPAQLQGKSLKEGFTATVAAFGDLGKSGELVFAEVFCESTELEVEDMVSITEGGIAELEELSISLKFDEFDPKKEISVFLNKGFIYGDTDKIKVAGARFEEKVDGDELIFYANEGADQVDITGIMIEATTAKVGDVAILKVDYKKCDHVSIEVAEVVPAELSLDVVAKTVKNGGKVSFDVFGIDKKHGATFVEGEEVKLTLSEGFAFVKGSVYDHDRTEIKVKEWGKNEVIVYAPANPEHGFDMEGMMIHATSAKPGDVATVTAYVDGYEAVSKDVLTVVKSSSGGGGGSKTTSAPASTPTPLPVSTEATTVETVQPISQADKDVYQAQLNEAVPAAEVVGDGAYTFAVAASEPSADATSGNTSSGVKDPAKVSIDLSGQNLEDTAHLTLVKYVTQPDGTVEVVKLGGTFDPETNTFSAYADGEGVYDLVHDPDVTKITFAIGQTEVSTNDAVQNSDVAPVLHENKTMVPLRVIAETLGAKVEWDEATKSVRMIQGDTVIVLEVDGEDGTAMIMNDRTMVQLRYIGENFGASVRWIPSTQSIEIVK